MTVNSMDTPREDSRFDWETYKETVAQFRNSILDCARNVKNNDRIFKISTLPEVGKQLSDLMNEYNGIIKDLTSAQKTFERFNSEDIIDEGEETDREPSNLTEISVSYSDTFEAERQGAPDETTALHALDDILRSVLNRDEDIVEEETGDRQVPKDPITLTNIKKALRSKRCKHIYDKQSIEAYITQKEKSKSTKIRCPVAGCTNDTLSKEELEFDFETNNLIDSLRH